MTAKKYLVTAIVLTGVLLAFAASLRPARHSGIEPRRMAMTGRVGEFGPVIDTVLPAEKSEGCPELLDLETGQALVQPSFDSGLRASEISAWIRSNGLDISSTVWSSGAGCITYDMTIIPVEGECWEKTAAQELLVHPGLSPRPHSPRRLLAVGNNQVNTYLFRTGDGTVGMLRIVGLNPGKQGVRICYKLINPAQSLSIAL